MPAEELGEPGDLRLERGLGDPVSVGKYTGAYVSTILAAVTATLGVDNFLGAAAAAAAPAAAPTGRPAAPAPGSPPPPSGRQRALLYLPASKRASSGAAKKAPPLPPARPATGAKRAPP